LTADSEVTVVCGRLADWRLGGRRTTFEVAKMADDGSGRQKGKNSAALCGEQEKLLKSVSF